MTSRNHFSSLLGNFLLLAVPAGLLAFFWTMVHFPAVMSVDSFMLVGEAIKNSYSGQHSPILGVITRWFILAFGPRVEILAFTQAFFYFFSGFFLLRTLMSKSLWALLFACGLFAAYPPGFVYSVTLWKDVFFVIQLNFLVSFLLHYYRNARLLNFFLVWFFLATAIMARHNAILILPALLPAMLLLYKRNPLFLEVSFSRKILLLCILATSALPPTLMNKMLGTRPKVFQNIVFVTMFSEWVTHHRRMGKPDDPVAKEFWDDALGNIGGHENLAGKSDSVRLGEAWTFMLHLDPDTDNQFFKVYTEIEGGLPLLLVNFFQRNPGTVLSYVYGYLKRLTYIDNDNPYWYHMNVWPENPMEVVAASKFPKFHSLLFQKILPRLYSRGFEKHWIPLLICLISFAFSLIAFLFSFQTNSYIRNHLPVLLLLPSICLGYFSGFIVVTAVADWRYLFPVSSLVYCLLVALFCDGAVQLWNKKVRPFCL